MFYYVNILNCVFIFIFFFMCMSEFDNKAVAYRFEDIQSGLYCRRQFSMIFGFYQDGFYCDDFQINERCIDVFHLTQDNNELFNVFHRLCNLGKLINEVLRNY